jgi:drug/metabolite transporter (DMT)-like permease
MIIIPTLAALTHASATILQRIVLKKKKISVKLYHVSEFFAIVLVMLPLIYFFWMLDVQAFELKNIFIFSLVILFSILANLFTFYSMKWEKISNLEHAKILEPLFVILLAIFFSYFISETLYERRTDVLIPALIAGCALVFSSIKKHHLRFNKYFIAAVIGSFFFAMELVISRLILDYYSPMTFYFFRSFFIFSISLILFRPKFSKLNKKIDLQILVIASFWVMHRTLVYYGYLELGVIFTTLIIMLSPIFIYFFAYFFLKEKLNWRNVAASVVIVISILYAIL